MKINIIGKGNVGSHLAVALRKAGEINSISSRSLNGLDREADLTVIAVSDSAIKDIALKLGDVTGIVVHTSGSTPLSILDGLVNRPGVIYPLQTFSKQRKLDYSKIPFFIETSNRNDKRILESIIADIGAQSISINSIQRKRLHLAAVFANNFSNYMITLGQRILSDQGLDSQLINPLVQETFEKLDTLPAIDAQTGPARRNDQSIIQDHLNELKKDPELSELSELYNLISKSISNLYDRNKTTD